MSFTDILCSDSRNLNWKRIHSSMVKSSITSLHGAANETWENTLSSFSGLPSFVKKISPFDGECNPLNIFTNVLFPLPLEPKTPYEFPALNWYEKSFRI